MIGNAPSIECVQWMVSSTSSLESAWQQGEEEVRKKTERRGQLPYFHGRLVITDQRHVTFPPTLLHVEPPRSALLG